MKPEPTKDICNVELLAPAGSFAMLQAAIKAGANAAYFGVKNLNMRAHGAVNFSLEDLQEISTLCKKSKIHSYLTVNSIIYNTELQEMQEIVTAAKKANITAIIAHDLATLTFAKKIGMPIHISTQANISNIEAVRFYAQFADAVVLARELTLDQIKEICDTIRNEKIIGPSKKLLKVEIFIHGALCVSISGKCYMSLAQYNKSANRGECLQACRRSYTVTDTETNEQLAIENEYVMSPKDLCTLPFLDRILAAGVNILKIEGRGRSPEYVQTVVETYKEAIELIQKNKFTEAEKKSLVTKLEKVFNRGFWQGGYYLGKKMDEWSKTAGSKATEAKKTLGIVKNYYTKQNVAEIEIQTDEVAIGDEIYIIGPTTGVERIRVTNIRSEKGDIKKAKAKTSITIPMPKKVRKNDDVFKIVKK